jgi:hypothetical protein
MSNEPPIRTEADLKRVLHELQEDTERMRKLRSDAESAGEEAYELAEKVYELRLDEFHSERGYRRIKDMANAAGVSFREAYTALGNEFRPDAPGVGEAGHGLSPRSTEMSAEEERQMHGYSHKDVEAHAKTRGIPYRAAMIELSATTKEKR